MTMNHANNQIGRWYYTISNALCDLDDAFRNGAWDEDDVRLVDALKQVRLEIEALDGSGLAKKANELDAKVAAVELDDDQDQDLELCLEFIDDLKFKLVELAEDSNRRIRPPHQFMEWYCGRLAGLHQCLLFEQQVGTPKPDWDNRRGGRSS